MFGKEINDTLKIQILILSHWKTLELCVIIRNMISKYIHKKLWTANYNENKMNETKFQM